MKIMRDATYKKNLDDAREQGIREVLDTVRARRFYLPKTSTEKRNLLRLIIHDFDPQVDIPESHPRRSTRVTSEERAEVLIEPR